jgi:hypothetical protein
MTEAMVRPSFQVLIESVEALSIEDREILIGIISKRIIEQRREYLVADLELSFKTSRDRWIVSQYP